MRRSFGLVLLVVAMQMTSFGCGNSSGSSPFAGRFDGGDASIEAGEASSEAGGATDAGALVLGGPCLENAQCDDHLDCTFDSCNLALRRCQFVPDDMRCQNGVFCDGVERCDSQLGCRPGSAPDCNDTNTCTIDACNEATGACDHAPRDADGDGNPDGHCGSTDCDDNDPTVYKGHPEICGNQKDDNCDGTKDEASCQTPNHDTCLDPLVVSQSGVYELDTTGAALNYGGSCMPMDPGNGRDVVAALELTDGAHDVNLVAEAPGGVGVVAVGLAGDCANPLLSERACGGGFPGPMNVRIARLRVHALAAGTYPVFVWTDRDQKVLLHVTLGAPSSPPANETCGSALPLTPGTKVVANLVGARPDLASRCGVATGDLVYQVTLATRSDLALNATSIDGYGNPVVSLRSASCTGVPSLDLDAGADARSDAAVIVRPPDELACAVGAEQAWWRARSPPEPITLRSRRRRPPMCSSRQRAGPRATFPATRPAWGRLHSLSIARSTSRWATTAMTSIYRARRVARSTRLMRSIRGTLRCAVGRAHRERRQGGPRALWRHLRFVTDAEVCGSSATSPVRVSLRGVPAGSYRAVVESSHRNDVQLTALVRPSVAPSLVPFADTCSSALLIDESGGFFQGNTDNAQGDYSAGCDAAGVGGGGAPNQLLKLVLSSKKRVIFNMQGSGYATLLDVRKGETCPGTEVPQGCSVGYDVNRSFLDFTLDTGTYW